MPQQARQFSENTRRLVAFLVLVPLLVLTTVSCKHSKPKPTKAQRVAALVKSCKVNIGDKHYEKAVANGELGVKILPKSAPAHFCLLAANLGAMVQSLSSIISLIATQVKSPADLRVSEIDGKSILNAVLADIESQMAAIDRETFVLGGMENPTFQIDSFVLGLDPTDLMKIIGSSTVKATGDLTLDLRGTWDKSEVLALGGLINGVQGILDYLFAHQLIISNTDIKFDTTEQVADFIYANPKLLMPDKTNAGDQDRMEGSDVRKGVKNDFVAALSYLVGRDAELANVAPANSGLAAAIKLSAENGAADAVIQWKGVDADGIPATLSIPALESLKNNITGIDLSTDFTNPLKPATWLAIIDLGKKVRDNIEAGGTPIGLKPVLQAVVDDLKADAANHGKAFGRLLGRDVPDVVAVNPGAFLSHPKYVRELIPYYFKYTTNGTTKHAELAIEMEKYSLPNNYLHKLGKDTDTYAADFTHFTYAAVVSPAEPITAGTSVQGYLFDGPDFTALTDMGGIKIEPDGVKAAAKTPELVYVGLQDPSLGGALLVDPAGNGAYAAATNLSFNQGLNKLLKNYCLDVTQDLLKYTFDDTKYPVSNKIADCTP